MAAPPKRGMGRGVGIGARFHTPESIAKKIESAHQNIDQIKSSLFDVERALKAKQYERDQLQGSEKLIAKDITEISKRQEKLRQTFQSNSATAKTQNERRDALVKELEKLRAALPKRGGGGTEEQLRSIDESLKKLEMQRGTSGAEKEKQIAMEIKKLREAKTQIGEFELRNEAIRKLRREIDKAEGEASKAKEQLSHIEEESQNLQKELTEVQSKIVEVNKAIEALQKEVATLKGKQQSEASQLQETTAALDKEKQSFYSSPQPAPSSPETRAKDDGLPKLDDIMTAGAVKYMMTKASTAKSQTNVGKSKGRTPVASKSEFNGPRTGETEKPKPIFDQDVLLADRLISYLTNLVNKGKGRQSGKHRGQTKGKKDPEASATGEAEPIEATETNDVPTGPLPRHPFEHVLEFERLSVVAPVTYEELPGALEQLRARKTYLKYVDGVRTGGLQKEKERQAQKAIEKAAAKAAAEEKRKVDEDKRAEEQRLADAAVPKEPEPIETPSKSQDVIDNADSTAKEEAQIAAEEAAPEPQQEQPDEESKSGADLVATEVSVDEASAEPETDSTAAEEPQPE